MSSNKYFPILKTTVSEIRAIRQLNCTEDSNITPIFELTKSRKSKYDEIGSVYKRIDEISEIVNQNKFILDITSEDSLSNQQIESFFDEHNHFENWRLFIKSLKERDLNVCPVIQAYDDSLETDLLQQMTYFSDNFQGFCIRLKPDYLEMDISDRLIRTAQAFNFILILDLEYIDDENLSLVKSKFKKYIERCLENSLSIKNIILCSSSFPPIVNHKNQFSGKISTLEKQVYQEFSRDFKDLDFNYGDYGSVHPFRNDTTAYNWVPRIDYPLESDIIFCRKQRDDGGYKDCANRIVKMTDFKNSRINCWGYNEIIDACTVPNGKSPSYWISVRINIHISRTLEWLSRTS